MIKSLLAITLIFTSFSLIAGAGPFFKNATCQADKINLTIDLTHQECSSSQYAQWNPQGCYHAKIVENGAIFFESEILRDFVYQEERHGRYGLYRYDDKEWIELGLLIRLTGDNSGHDFRLDVRGDGREQMVVKAVGKCSL
ncbi:MAG: hypothetical protein HN353_07740 [Bdellovibrionales bacterium]|jgi:hypothetical protein|nr:hypothetical protein [Bdellovibrionales bacterium]MBT3525811.1 hypothetical protein [Bdellovibrionales bacterium]MBT7668051.1 hypothetical protein [Bdellovibrionales bacterium]MBT7766570.1 hypothetical protein [Bdellovibrionales bacterium]